MTTCKGCGAEIVWRQFPSTKGGAAGAGVWRALDAESRREHRCPAYARERKAGYALGEHKARRELEAQAALYSGEEEG